MTVFFAGRHEVKAWLRREGSQLHPRPDKFLVYDSGRVRIKDFRRKRKWIEFFADVAEAGNGDLTAVRMDDGYKPRPHCNPVHVFPSTQ